MRNVIFLRPNEFSSLLEPEHINRASNGDGQREQSPPVCTTKKKKLAHDAWFSMRSERFDWSESEHRTHCQLFK